MHLFNDLFMAEFVTDAEEAIAERDEHARARQMAALAANILARLATSELLESETQTAGRDAGGWPRRQPSAGGSVAWHTLSRGRPGLHTIRL